MGYDRSVYDSVYQILNGRRLQAEQAAERRRTDFYRVEPRGQEIEHELRQAGASAAKAVIRGGNVKKNLDQLKKRSLALQDELKSLMARQSMAPEDLEPHYT